MLCIEIEHTAIVNSNILTKEIANLFQLIVSIKENLNH